MSFFFFLLTLILDLNRHVDRASIKCSVRLLYCVNNNDRHISVSNEDKEPECVNSILEVNSNHIMDFSDDEGTMGTTDNPIEMIIDEEDEDAELHKAYLPRGMIHTELEIKTAVKGLGSSYLRILQARAFN